MTTKVQKWGNSLAVRLPKELAKNLHLSAGVRVSFVTKKNSFEIKAETRPIKKYILEELLKSITSKNYHSEYDWGKTVGKEVW